jgi:competence protein ComEA
VTGRSRGRPGEPGTRLIAAALAAGLVAVGTARLQRPVRLADRGAVEPLPQVTIDVNRAAAGELTLLPGVGPTLAERIVADRRRRGPFASVADLARVDGVGPVTVTRARALAVTSSESH